VNERPVLVIKNPDIPHCSPVGREECTGEITTLLATKGVLNILCSQNDNAQVDSESDD